MGHKKGKLARPGNIGVMPSEVAIIIRVINGSIDEQIELCKTTALADALAAKAKPLRLLMPKAKLTYMEECDELAGKLIELAGGKMERKNAVREALRVQNNIHTLKPYRSTAASESRHLTKEEDSCPS